MLKSKNRYFYHIFVFPGDAPGAITLNVVWMEREFDAYRLSRSMYHLSSTVSQLFEPQVQKIAIFTYRRPHFCFPWRHPCDYHGTCCMAGKTIQCLPNASQHVPICLQKNSSFYHTSLHSTPSLGGFPSEYRHPLWDGKTRMVSLPDGK